MPHITLTDNNFHNPPKLLEVAKENEAAIHAYEDLQLVQLSEGDAEDGGLYHERLAGLEA